MDGLEGVLQLIQERHAREQTGAVSGGLGEDQAGPDLCALGLKSLNMVDPGSEIGGTTGEILDAMSEIRAKTGMLQEQLSNALSGKWIRYEGLDGCESCALVSHVFVFNPPDDGVLVYIYVRNGENGDAMEESGGCHPLVWKIKDFDGLIRRGGLKVLSDREATA